MARGPPGSTLVTVPALLAEATLTIKLNTANAGVHCLTWPLQGWDTKLLEGLGWWKPKLIDVTQLIQHETNWRGLGSAMSKPACKRSKAEPEWPHIRTEIAIQWEERLCDSSSSSSSGEGNRWGTGVKYLQ